jgi:hypothetical protein
MVDDSVIGRPRGGHRSLLNSNSILINRTWINWRPGGALRWKGETVGWEHGGVVCGKLAPLRLYLPPVSIKDRWVGPREQVLNVPFTYRWYGPGKPSSRPSTEDCLCPHCFIGWLKRETGYGPTDRSADMLWIVSRVVALLNSVDDYTKGCYALTTWDTYGLGPYADWACDACDILVGFSPVGCISIRIAVTLRNEWPLFRVSLHVAN